MEELLMSASPRIAGAVLSETMYAGLRQIADDECTSVASIVRRAIKRELERLGHDLENGPRVAQGAAEGR